MTDLPVRQRDGWTRQVASCLIFQYSKMWQLGEV